MMQQVTNFFKPRIELAGLWNNIRHFKQLAEQIQITVHGISDIRILHLKYHLFACGFMNRSMYLRKRGGANGDMVDIKLMDGITQFGL